MYQSFTVLYVIHQRKAKLLIYRQWSKQCYLQFWSVVNGEEGWRKTCTDGKEGFWKEIWAVKITDKNWMIRRNKDVKTLYYHLDTINEVKSEGIWWLEHVQETENGRIIKFLWGQPEDDRGIRPRVSKAMMWRRSWEELWFETSGRW